MHLSIEIIIKFQPNCVFLHVYSQPIRSNGLTFLAHQEFSMPPSSAVYLTEHSTISEPEIPAIDRVYVVQKHRSTVFEVPEHLKVWS